MNHHSRPRHFIRWTVIAALTLLAIVLGLAGFHSLGSATNQSHKFLDILYLTIQLFVLESGNTNGPVPWSLQIARFLAPALTAYTAIQALLVVFGRQFDLTKVKFYKNHAIIAGLGKKGLLLANAFIDRGEKVVLIELDEDNDYISGCRERGIIVLTGNAADVMMLRKAAAAQAKYLFSVTGDDGVNAEIAIHATNIQRANSETLDCFIHVVDPQLWRFLRTQEITGAQPDRFRFQFFNSYDSAARSLWSEFPAFGAAAPRGSELPLIVGFGRMGENIVLQMARYWNHPHEPLRIRIIDRNAKQKSAALLLRYPYISELCRIEPVDLEVGSAEFYEGGYLKDVTVVYVALNQDSVGLSAALTLEQMIVNPDVMVVVRLAQQGGISRLLGKEDGFRGIHSFGLLEKTCDLDFVLAGTNEILARAIHEEYIAEQKNLGVENEESQAAADWELLPEQWKEASRRQADHIGLKLKTIHCGIIPLTHSGAASFLFTDEEVEQLARMEHDRWVQEKTNEGWKAGASKNVDKKINPYLIAFDDLPKDIQEANRKAIRSLPAFLARAGFEIYRT